MFLNKAFITAWLAQARSALSNVNSVGWPWLSDVWMYHWSPTTSLSLCIVMTVVTSLRLEVYGWVGAVFWEWAGGDLMKGSCRWEKEATLKLHDHCEILQINLVCNDDIFFHGGIIWNTLPPALSPSLRLFTNKIQPLRSHIFSCLAFGHWWISSGCETNGPTGWNWLGISPQNSGPGSRWTWNTDFELILGPEGYSSVRREHINCGKWDGGVCGSITRTHTCTLTRTESLW